MEITTMLLVILLLNIFGSAISFQCLSSTGSPVDWFIVYKLPILTKSKNPIFKNGEGYYYMDNKEISWRLSDTGIQDTRSNAVFNTLQQIYRPPKNGTYMYAFYNDQTPNGKDYLNHGHTKGAVGFDQSDGFWLVQSTPHFPPKQADGYSWPKSGHPFGQTLLCVSYPVKMLNAIGTQFIYNYPKIYDRNFPDSFASIAPEMAKVMSKSQARRTSAPWQNREQLVSKAGTAFISFAKSSKFGADLYDDFVSKALQESLLVETWQNGDKLSSNCTGQFKVINVQGLTFPNKDIRFKETKDHSKWAVSQTAGWTCIGDINRQITQFKRGGGTVCLRHNTVWKNFDTLISKTENCSKSYA